jgi:hypothetical protein
VSTLHFPSQNSKPVSDGVLLRALLIMSAEKTHAPLSARAIPGAVTGCNWNTLTFLNGNSFGGKGACIRPKFDLFEGVWLATIPILPIVVFRFLWSLRNHQDDEIPCPGSYDHADSGICTVSLCSTIACALFPLFHRSHLASCFISKFKSLSGLCHFLSFSIRPFCFRLGTARTAL